MKPSRVEPGQVWVLEEVGLPGFELREPAFRGAFLVTRLVVLESRRTARELGEPYTEKAYGIVLDEPVRHDVEPDGTACIDYPELMLHAGDRTHDDSSYRWRFVA